MKTKLYIASRNKWEESYTIGVFSSLEKAKDAIISLADKVKIGIKYKNNYIFFKDRKGEWSFNAFPFHANIEEVILDKVTNVNKYFK